MKEVLFFPTIPLEIDEHHMLLYKEAATLFLYPN